MTEGQLRSAEQPVPQATSASTISFAPFCLDLRGGRLLCGAEPVALRPKTWTVLRYLAERPGELVTKRDLLDAVWPDVAVTESVMSKSIGELRVAFGDSSRSPRFIETVQRRGFRFVAATTGSSSPSQVPGFTEDAAATVDEQTEVPYFVGRARELRRLTALLTKARAGERQIAFITGATGIGKTTLVNAFLDAPAIHESTAPIWIGRGVCVEQHGPREAYMPVIDALERLARGPDADRLAAVLRRVAPTWLAQVPALISDHEAQALRQSLQAVRPARMLREFAALVEALATDVTLVLVLEDLHWSDAATVDLLAVLGERRESARLLVIGTYRPADAVVHEHVLLSATRTLHARRHCVELPLADLNDEGVRRYLEARFPGSNFPPMLAQRVHKHTDGNPLFMVGVVDHLLSRGEILDTEPGWALRAPLEKIDLGVPEDVRLLIENQLDALSPADRALMQAASVAGNEFTPLVVSAALGSEVDDAEMRCDSFARAQRFLRVAGSVEWPDRSVTRCYAFTHELYRQVVYAGIPEGHCMQLHQRIGQALENAYGARHMDIAPQLATHFERGRDDVRALRYLGVAAARARQRFANREAIGYLEAAIALVVLLPDEDERRRRELELRLPLGAALSDIHGFASEEVRQNYDRAAALAAAVGNATQRLELLYARWYLHAICGERQETIAIATELDDCARRLRAAEYRALADSVLVRTALYDGRFVEVNRRMQGRRQRQRPNRSIARVPYGPDPAIVTTSHFAMALWFLGHTERAQSTMQVAVAQARASGDFFTVSAVLVQAVMVELLCRNAAEGGKLADEAASLSAEHGFAFWHAVTTMLAGWALVQQGKLSEGSAAIERALSAMQATGTRFLAAFAYAFLAEGRLRSGALDEGLAAADAGLAVAHATLNRAYEPELWRLKGELLLEQSKIEGSKRNARKAEACFQRALELARAAQAKSLELRAATSLACLWRTRGRTTSARRLLGGICKWFGARAQTADLVEARALLAELAGAKSAPLLLSSLSIRERKQSGARSASALRRVPV